MKKRPSLLTNTADYIHCVGFCFILCCASGTIRRRRWLDTFIFSLCAACRLDQFVDNHSKAEGHRLSPWWTIGVVVSYLVPFVGLVISLLLLLLPGTKGPNIHGLAPWVKPGSCRTASLNRRHFLKIFGAI